MKTLTQLKRMSGRSSREDGEATRAKIIEVAGKLFAERGFAETTSKEICEAARTNLTAVNYHFGSREGLYMAIIREVQEYLLSQQFIRELVESPMQPREKMEFFLDSLSTMNFDKDSWQIRVWAREVVAPTPLWCQVAQEDSMSKLNAVFDIISETTGIPLGHPMLSFCFLNVMAPFMVLLLTSCSPQSPHRPVFECDEATASDNVKDFVLAGLDRMAEKYAAQQQANNLKS